MANTLNTPYTILKPFAENGDKNDIPETVDPELGLMSQDAGFPPITSKPIYEGGVAPNRRDFNGAFNILAQHNFFMQNGGTYTFNQDLSDSIGGYPAGIILSYKPTTGSPYLVQSLIDNNTNNFVLNPALIDGAHWKKINATAEELDNYVNLTSNQNIAGEKTFSNSPVFLQYPYNIILKSNIIDITEVAPDTNKYVGIEFRDKNNVRLAWIGVSHKTNGISRLEIQNQNMNSNPVLSVNPPSNSNDTSIATTSWVRSNVGGGIPVGTILPYGGTTAPEGFLLCNGGAISRTTYANLFSVIGTAYGTGDGNTTFNLPNANNRYIGYGDRGYLSANLPNITGTIEYHVYSVNATGAFVNNGGTKRGGVGYDDGSVGANKKLDASRSSSIYTSINEVRPLTLRTNLIIKY